MSTRSFEGEWLYIIRFRSPYRHTSISENDSSPPPPNQLQLNDDDSTPTKYASLSTLCFISLLIFYFRSKGKGKTLVTSDDESDIVAYDTVSEADKALEAPSTYVSYLLRLSFPS